MRSSPHAQNLEWSVSFIVCEYVDAQIDESRSYCENKPHISYLLFVVDRWGGLSPSPEEAVTHCLSD